jgi:LysR family transcriptional regulator, nod-box dependent transcriptional activator
LDTKLVVPVVGTLPIVVPGTNLIATVPRRLVTRLERSATLSVFPCPIPMPDIVETMLWHPRADRDPSHAWFRRLVAEAGARLAPFSS